MKKLTSILLSLTLLISCSQKQEKEVLSEKPTVKIGFILPLSGDNTHLGQPEKYAAELVLKELKGKNTKYHYEFIFEDNRMEAKLTAPAAYKLINIDKVDAIISISGITGNILTPLAQNNKIIHFGVTSDPNVAHGNFNFTHLTPPELEARVMVKILVEKGLTRVALITLNQPGCLACKDPLIKLSKNTPIQIVADEKYNSDERDFRPMLTRLAQKNPDIYILTNCSPTLEIIAKQMKELGMTTPMTAIESFEYTTDFPLFEGNWYIQTTEIDDSLRQKFYNKFGGNTSLFGVGNVMDAVNIISHAYENYPSTGKPSTEQIAQAILDLKTFDGVLGKLTIPPSGIIESPPTLKEIKNGKPVVVSRNP